MSIATCPLSFVPRVLLVAGAGCLLAQAPLLSQSETTGTATDATTSRAKPVYKLLPPPADYSPARISIPEPLYDWGTVLQGEVIQHAFRVRNTGGAPLRIERVKPSCGCTTVDFTKAVEPGQAGEITLKIETQNLGSGSDRPLTKTAQVYTSASKTPEKLTITGKVMPAFIMEPQHPTIEVVKGIEAPPTTVTLRRASDKPIKIKNIDVKPAAGLNPATSQEDVIEAKLHAVEEGSVYELTITPSVPASSNRRYYSAQLSADIDVDGRSFSIPIRIPIRVKDRISATPPSIFFPRREAETLKQEGASPVTKTVTIKSLDPNHTFRITGVDKKEAAIETQIETVTEGKEYRLLVSLVKYPEVERSTLMDGLVVHTDDPTLPEIKVHVRASLASPRRTANILEKGGKPSALPLLPKTAGSSK